MNAPRWYVVCGGLDLGGKPADTWTVSLRPNLPGWETCGGSSGCGLTKALAEELRPTLPPGVEIEADATGHLIVYRPDVVKLVTDSDPAFYGHGDIHDIIWHCVHSEQMGGLLGYGALTLNELGSVPVYLLDPKKNIVAGFHTPIATAEKYAEARALDYARYTGKEITFKIITKNEP